MFACCFFDAVAANALILALRAVTAGWLEGTLAT
jgi:hypothetical protein